MDERQSKLLAAIIDQFIETALPVGSMKLLENQSFRVSGATIRNEMRELEDLGYLEQPHISAGRIPTAEGYRAYVKEFMRPKSHERRVRQRFEGLKEQYFHRKDQEHVYEAVSLLSQMIPHVAFATVPHKPQVYFLGLCNVLRQPEFMANPMLATHVVEVLEQRLTDFLRKVQVDDRVRYYIGEEHVLPQLQSCGMIVTTYSVRGKGGVIGILGPMRMDYGYNTVALEMVRDLLSSW